MRMRLLLVAAVAMVACSESPTDVDPTQQHKVPAPVPTCSRADLVLEEVEELVNQGHLPQSTFDWFFSNRRKLCNDDNFFVNAIKADPTRFSQVYNKDGGTESGPTTIVKNLYGITIGKGTTHITYSDGMITGHSASGHIIFGRVDSEQIGQTWTEQCPGGGTRECGSYQNVFTQGIEPWLDWESRSEPSTLCAPCPEA